MTTDVARLLQSMPDLEPPADSWQRIAARQARLGRLHRAGGLAAAASVVIAIVTGYLYLQQPEVTAEPIVSPTVQPMIVSAPVERAVDARVRALQERSQYMERVLSGLPRRGPVARADTAGVIAELEDRIAAVDYQLNGIGLRRTGSDRRQPGRSEWRAPGEANVLRYEQTDAQDLWRRRVEFMDQLVRVRYAEIGSSGL